MSKKSDDKNRCWEGYEPVKGKKPYEKGSCVKKSASHEGVDMQNQENTKDQQDLEDLSKQAFHFYAGDGDAIGAEVGRAVLQDDANRLHEISTKINAGQEAVLDWAEQRGGQIISAGGDEFVFALPEKADEDEIEELRDLYHQMTGATLTIGCGETMSQAGKALIYGKLHGKDQAVHFAPEIEDALVEAHHRAETGEATEEEQKQDEHYLADTMKDRDGSHHHEEHWDDFHEDEENQSEGHMESTALEAPMDEEMSTEMDDASDMEEDYTQEIDMDDEQPHVDEADLPEKEKSLYDNHDAEDQESDLAADVAANPSPYEEATLAKEKDEYHHVMERELNKGTGLALKDTIAETLSAFEHDKEFIDAAKEQSPELYQASIELLEKMIEVMRMLKGVEGAAPQEEQSEDSVEEAPQEETPMEEAPNMGKPQP